MSLSLLYTDPSSFTYEIAKKEFSDQLFDLEVSINNFEIKLSDSSEVSLPWRIKLLQDEILQKRKDLELHSKGFESEFSKKIERNMAKLHELDTLCSKIFSNLSHQAQDVYEAKNNGELKILPPVDPYEAKDNGV